MVPKFVVFFPFISFWILETGYKKGLSVLQREKELVYKFHILATSLYCGRKGKEKNSWEMASKRLLLTQTPVMVQVLAHFLNPLKIVFLALFSVLSCGKNNWVFFFFFFLAFFRCLYVYACTRGIVLWVGIFWCFEEFISTFFDAKVILFSQICRSKNWSEV